MLKEIGRGSKGVLMLYLHPSHYTSRARKRESVDERGGLRNLAVLPCRAGNVHYSHSKSSMAHRVIKSMYK
jgi:hypothetical protein